MTVTVGKHSVVGTVYVFNSEHQNGFILKNGLVERTPLDGQLSVLLLAAWLC